jgi:hypothetical protein
MAESRKRQSAKKGNRAPAPRPGRNSEGVRRKDGPAAGHPQFAGARQPGAPSAAPPGAPPASIPQPPTPRPGPPMIGAGGPPPAAGPGAPPLGAPPAGAAATQPPQPAPPGPDTMNYGIPPNAGPGVPQDMQALPTDMQALAQTMHHGLAPGSSDGDHEMALNAAAMVQASEHQAMQQAFQQTKQSMDIMELGRLLSRIMQGGSPATASAPQPPGPLSAMLNQQ